MSRTGYVIMYGVCPIQFVSKLQTENSLSGAEADYIALSQALQELIPLMILLKEINNTFPILLGTPDFGCTVHEENQSCIKMSELEKFTPHSKHISSLQVICKIQEGGYEVLQNAHAKSGYFWLNLSETSFSYAFMSCSLGGKDYLNTHSIWMPRHEGVGEYTDRAKFLRCCVVIWYVLIHALNWAKTDVPLEFWSIRGWNKYRFVSASWRNSMYFWNDQKLSETIDFHIIDVELNDEKSI